MEEEYWRQCRRQAEYLFDTRDYHVATALYRIFEYSAHKGKREQGKIETSWRRGLHFIQT